MEVSESQIVELENKITYDSVELVSALEKLKTKVERYTDDIVKEINNADKGRTGSGVLAKKVETFCKNNSISADLMSRAKVSKGRITHQRVKKHEGYEWSGPIAR